MVLGQICVLVRRPKIANSIISNQNLKGRIKVIEVAIDASSMDEKQVCDEIGDSEILFCDPELITPFFEKLHKVKWVQSSNAGIDTLVGRSRELKQVPHFVMTRFGSFFGLRMAEFVVGQIIARERCFMKRFQDQKAHKWQVSRTDVNSSHCRSLPGLVIGILGIGDIGKSIAKACQSLGMIVYALNSSNNIQGRSEPCVDQFFARDDLPSLLQQSDYVCNVLPITPSTNGILSNGILRHCAGKKSVFVNVGRGNVIRDQEIVEAIKNRWIGGAILDVFEEEPLPTSSPLWDMEEVTISPHCSGLAAEQTNSIFLQNLERYDKGEELLFVVDWNKGY